MAFGGLDLGPGSVDNRHPAAPHMRSPALHNHKMSTIPMSLDLWQRGCQRLATELPEQQFNTWIRPLPAAEPRPACPGTTRLELRQPNRSKLY